MISTIKTVQYYVEIVTLEIRKGICSIYLLHLNTYFVLPDKLFNFLKFNFLFCKQPLSFCWTLG